LNNELNKDIGAPLTYETDQKIKSFLDTNQLGREQMCRSILALDKRFSDVRPRHPRGGRDGGRDIEANFRNDHIAFGAVGFVNQANDSAEQKKTINVKFNEDLKNAISAPLKPEVFVFFTNINLTIGEKELLIREAKLQGLIHCEIMDRERIRISLDTPDGFSIRFQYLNIPLSEEEQASFFAKWGDDIQSVISTGFQRVEKTLNRILFFQEASSTLSHLTLSIELKEKFSAEDIGHFRLFCELYLKEPKNNIFSILFGCSDKSNRMREDNAESFSSQKSGIKHGIAGGQWEQKIASKDENHDFCERKYIKVGSSSGIGMDNMDFISIQYSKDSLIRSPDGLALKDLDEAMLLPFCNNSLAEKLKAIHIYSNGYKIKELGSEDIEIDSSEFEPSVPVYFNDEETKDPWVRIRPTGGYSAINIEFFDETPKRMFMPKQTVNSLEK